MGWRLAHTKPPAYWWYEPESHAPLPEEFYAFHIHQPFITGARPLNYEVLMRDIERIERCSGIPMEYWRS